MPVSIEYTRPPLYPYQSAIIDSPKRYTVTEASTKVGKSASHLVWLFEQPLKLGLKPGQKVWWIAPVYAQAEIMFFRLKNQLSVREFLTFNETKLKATFPTGAEIHFKSAEKPDNLYGDDVYAAVFDEFPRARQEAWFALRSTLTATKGWCKFIGNVKGKKNWGYLLAQQAKQQKDDPESDWDYFKITAYDAVNAGLLSREEVEAARRDLPENVFKELYLAEASDDGSNPFGITHIAKCVFEISKTPTVCYGIDLAKKNDWTAITGLDKHGNITYFDRFQLDWKQTRERILALPPGIINIDSTGVGDPIAEDIARHRQVQQFQFTSRSKQRIMEGLAYAIQNRKITVLDGVMKDELESFEFQYTRTGVTYSAPAGLHDDCVCSLALANDILSSVANFGEINIW